MVKKNYTYRGVRYRLGIYMCMPSLLFFGVWQVMAQKDLLQVAKPLPSHQTIGPLPSFRLPGRS